MEKQQDLFADNGGRPKKKASAPVKPEPKATAKTPETLAVAQAKEAPAPRPATTSGSMGDDAFRWMVDSNFIQYASYVIRDRAIPDVADGLKPVQRRILYALAEKDDGKFIKVANIVGHTMQYHPHGDASIADALVSLTNRRYLIEGQGNFGNIFTGDPAAASRYIECRLTPLAREEIFNDALTAFVPSYDGRNKEPVRLPAKLPLLLMLGAEGIAVGLSTRILPHNFGELINAQIAILQKKPFELLPDFQQAGLMDASEYEKGNGRIRLRAAMEPRGEHAVVITELPFGATTDSIMASIEDAARKKKISIKSIDDFTAAKVEILVQLGQGDTPAKAIEKLYAFTQCEVSISPRLTVIRDNRPVEMDVDEVIRQNTKDLKRILERELRLEHANLLEELHAKTLIQLFVEHRIYKDIEECKTFEAVKKAVFDGVNKYRDQLRRDVTAKDVEMLLGIAIKRISKFDLEKSRKDLERIVKELAAVEKNLSDLKNYTIRYLKNLLRSYGADYPRRTKIKAFKAVEVRELTAADLTVGFDPEKGYVGHEVKGEELFSCSPHDRVLVVWKDGRYTVTPPPDKVFVGDDYLYCAIMNRTRVYTMVFTHEDSTYLKKFTFGGAIMNKEYFCTPEGSKVLLFTEGKPGHVYVKYAKQKRLRILQQAFETAKIPTKGVKAKGIRMTIKKVRWIGTEKPRGWDNAQSTPSGAFMDFL